MNEWEVYGATCCEPSAKYVDAMRHSGGLIGVALHCPDTARRKWETNQSSGEVAGQLRTMREVLDARLSDAGQLPFLQTWREMPRPGIR